VLAAFAADGRLAADAMPVRPSAVPLAQDHS
jgi:hypothetical protein